MCSSAERNFCFPWAIWEIVLYSIHISFLQKISSDAYLVGISKQIFIKSVQEQISKKGLDIPFDISEKKMDIPQRIWKEVESNSHMLLSLGTVEGE